MRLMLACVLAILLSSTIQAGEGTTSNAATVPIVVEQPNADALGAGTKLAALLNPTDLIVAAEMRGFDEQLIPGFRRQKDFMELEARYPGLIDAIARDLRPQLEEFAIGEAPSAHRKMGLFLAQRFTLPELREISTFYTSPTGVKIIRAVFANISMQAVVSEVISNPDAPTSLDAVNRMYDRSLEALPAAMGEADYAALAEFAKKPYFSRLAAAGPEMREMQQKLINQPAPAFEAALEKTIEQSIDRFIAKSDGEARQK